MYFDDANILATAQSTKRLLALLDNFSPLLHSHLTYLFNVGVLPKGSIWIELAHNSACAYGLSPKITLDITTAIFAIQIGTGLLDHVQDGDLPPDLNPHHIVNLSLALTSCAFSLVPKTQVIQLLSDTIIRMCEGQNQDLCANTSAPTPKEYESLIRTRVGTFGAFTLQLPAIVSGQPIRVVEALARLGEQLALLYQIRNDQEGAFGINPSTDLIRRWTWPSVFALNVISEAERDLYLTTKSSGDQPTLRKWLLNWGALQYMAALEAHYITQLIDTFRIMDHWDFKTSIRDYCARCFHFTLP